jgi:hypothetical protein
MPQSFVMLGRPSLRTEQLSSAEKRVVLTLLCVHHRYRSLWHRMMFFSNQLPQVIRVRHFAFDNPSISRLRRIHHITTLPSPKTQAETPPVGGRRT